jgi:hypothetical protein
VFEANWGHRSPGTIGTEVCYRSHERVSLSLLIENVLGDAHCIDIGLEVQSLTLSLAYLVEFRGYMHLVGGTVRLP